MFQQYSLYPHLSVFDNLAFPLRSPARRMPEPRSTRTVQEVARLLQIEDKLANRATQLSGGQMQRVAIGRALVRRPAIYLMDEPLSSLDAKLRAELRIELKRIQQDLGATILYVTHDQTEAMTLATRIGVIDQGRLVQVGTPREIYEEPGQHLCRDPARQPGHQPAAARALPHTASAGRRCNDRRAHRARSHPQGARTARPIGTVTWIEHLGDQNHLHVAVAERRLRHADRSGHRASGSAIRSPSSSCEPLFFAADGRRL